MFIEFPFICFTSQFDNDDASLRINFGPDAALVAHLTSQVAPGIAGLKTAAHLTLEKEYHSF